MHKRDRPSAGFTIVELLIVIVVIAILAAISTVAYRGIQERARASEVSSALAQAKKKLELYKVDHSTYPTTGNLASAGITANDGSFQYTSDGSTFCLTATSGTVSYTATNTTSPTQGGCAGHGQGGVAAVTNLVYNPGAVSGVGGYSGWAGSGGGAASLSRVTATWATRGYAARSTYSVANNAYNGDIGWHVPNTGGAFSLEPNTQYTARWKVTTSKAQRIQAFVGVWAIVGGANSSGTGTLNNSSAVQVTTAGVPLDQQVTFTTGANTVSAKIYSSLTTGTGASYWQAGDYLEASDFMLVRGSTAYGYADGDSPNWTWNGTPNNSSSTGPSL